MPAVSTQREYPDQLVVANHVEPAPGRLRGFVKATKMLDTTSALYV